MMLFDAASCKSEISRTVLHRLERCPTPHCCRRRNDGGTRRLRRSKHWRLRSVHRNDLSSQQWEWLFFLAHASGNGRAAKRMSGCRRTGLRVLLVVKSVRVVKSAAQSLSVTARTHLTFPRIHLTLKNLCRRRHFCKYFPCT